MSEIKLYKSSWKAIRLLALSILFVILGIWTIKTERMWTFDYFMGWVISCFFGLSASIGFFHFFDKRPQIIINEHGIWDRTTNQDEIRWEQIKRAYSVNIYGQKFISLNVDNSFVFKQKEYKWAAKIRTKIKAQRLNVSLGQIKIDEKQFIFFINKMSKTKFENRIELINKSNHFCSDI